MKYTKFTFAVLWVGTLLLSSMILWEISWQIVEGTFVAAAAIFLNRILPNK